MMQTVEAEIDINGQVHLLEKIKTGKKYRALVTILEDEKDEPDEKFLFGSIEILDENLETGSREISGNFNRSITRSAEDLTE